MFRNRAIFIFYVFSVIFVVCLVGCAKKDAPVKSQAEKPVGAIIVNGGEKPVVQEKLPPATLKDVQDAVHRVLGDNVVISSRIKPVFIEGDFNGDHVEDLAVAVEPVPGKLGEINSELANWIVQDANDFFLPKPNVHAVRMPEPHATHVEAGETLLAVIHGFGPKGWRNPEARQTYLVKHAAANFLGTARSFSQKYIREMKLIIETDVIKENRDNKNGFLFWTGSNYAWHPNNG